jgi:hypothetical protein
LQIQPSPHCQKSPEARLNQIFLRLNESRIDLSPTIVSDGELSQGTSPHHLLDSFQAIPSPSVSEQPLIRLYGGSKLYSSGYCEGDVFDLCLVPTLKPTEGTKYERSASTASSTSSPTTLRRQHSVFSVRGVPSLEGSDDDEMSTATGASLAEREGMGKYHRLNLKEESTVRLLAPKSGIEGKYFLLKTELSHSKSTFTIGGDSSVAGGVGISGGGGLQQLPHLPPPKKSSLSPLRAATLHHPHQLLPLKSISADRSNSPLNKGVVSVGSSKQRSRHSSPHAKNQLAPLPKGLSIHEARDQFLESNSVDSAAMPPRR